MYTNCFSRFLIFVVLLLCVSVTKAEEESYYHDTLEVFFKLYQAKIDPYYLDNMKHIEDFVDRIKEIYDQHPDTLLSLTIYSECLPGADYHYKYTDTDIDLGAERAILLKTIINEKVGVNLKFTVVNRGSNWKGLYDKISSSNEPWKDEVLQIIKEENSNFDYNYYKNNRIDPRTEKLHKLNRGKVWKEIELKYMMFFEKCVVVHGLPIYR